jgi:hypothetical protein
LDTSAGVKLYVIEVGTTWMRSTTDPVVGHRLMVSMLFLAEGFAAISKRERQGDLSAAAAEVARGDLEADYRRRFKPLLVTDEVVTTAAGLTRQHPLRGYDAVQLATALILNTAQLLEGLSPIMFISADKNLCKAARSCGLIVENPEDHLDFTEAT